MNPTWTVVFVHVLGYSYLPLIYGGSLILVQKVFEGRHMHTGLNLSAFSIEEFFGSKPDNDVKCPKI